jgi:hypothetical protein
MRRQRREEEKARRASESRRQNLLVGVALALIVLLVGFVLFQSFNPANQPGVAARSLGNEHLTAVDDPHIPYNTVPPTSGPHMGGLWSWGISEEQIADEWQVHNLEDGGVVLQYDCPDGCEELKTQLTIFANQVLTDPQFLSPAGNVHFILAPYDGIRAASGGKPIAMTAWGRYQYFDGFDREGMLAFIRAYINIDHHVRGIG